MISKLQNIVMKVSKDGNIDLSGSFKIVCYVRITRILDCVRRPVIENTTFRKLFPSSSVKGNVYSVGSHRKS
jgi:hypothetical protein